MLSALHLTRRFGDRTAVDDVSFELAPGEIFALLGPNGAGKTTTLRMLAALIAPSSGEVRIGGQTVTRRTAHLLRSKIGFLTEAPGLWERLTVRQNLLAYARLHGLANPSNAVESVLESFDLRDRATQLAAHLSKGLKQRVALARTLLHQPEIVLLDEPTAGLDPEMARDLRNIVLQLRSQRRALLISTHNLDEVERVADRVAVLRGGLVALDTPDNLRARLFGPRVRVVIAQTAAAFVPALSGFSDVTAHEHVLSIGVASPSVEAPVIVRQLVSAGADIQSVGAEEPPLEDVYIRLLNEGDA